jgi:hypothetical protein
MNVTSSTQSATFFQTSNTRLDPCNISSETYRRTFDLECLLGASIRNDVMVVPIAGEGTFVAAMKDPSAKIAQDCLGDARSWILIMIARLSLCRDSQALTKSMLSNNPVSL